MPHQNKPSPIVACGDCTVMVFNAGVDTTYVSHEKYPLSHDPGWSIVIPSVSYHEIKIKQVLQPLRITN